MKRMRPLMSAAVLVSGVAAPFVIAGGSTAGAETYAKHTAINCSQAAALCTEVADSKKVFGHYVGHDEPSMLFYSTTPGSGNHMRYNLTLPQDPSATNPTEPGKSYEFELSGAQWFGMAICDTQSYPELVSTCPADSDSNILEPYQSAAHVGQAYMELQFYPPGWIQWPTWQVAVGASSCDPTKWCAALNIDSLSLNPITGQTNNTTCLNQVGEEYVNFAFVTLNGQSTGPANPVQATTAGTYTPDPNKDLFMNPGDKVTVSIGDTSNGLQVILHDATSGRTGSMTASAANGFAQVKFDPTGSSCTAIPYDFHPMYSTSTPQTRVTWAAHSYNVAYDTEIGHFQFCNGPYAIPATEFGIDSEGNPTTCPADDTERNASGPAPNDGDDYFCFPGSESPLYNVSGCTYTNTGFDGASYQKLWPDGNQILHPTSPQISSPLTGSSYSTPYQRAALEADLPAIEGNQNCDSNTGSGCTLIPITDSLKPAAFYPFYSTHMVHGSCVWEFGNTGIPDQISDFGGESQWGSIFSLSYTAQGGGYVEQYNDFRHIMSNVPC